MDAEHVFLDLAKCFDWDSVWELLRREPALVIQFMHARGVDVNAHDRADFWRPLHFAAGYGHVQAVRMLCQLGADIDAQDMDGRTAAHVAAENGHAGVIQELHGFNANFMLTDDRGFTAAHEAVLERQAGVVQVFNGFGVYVPALNEVQDIL